MSLPQSIVEVLPSDNELVIGVVTDVTPLIVNTRGASITPGILGSYSPTIGDNVAMIREEATYLAIGALRNAGRAPAYGGPTRLIRRGARTTSSTPAAAEQPVLRVDDIPLVMGNQYYVHVPSVNLVATAADRANLNLRFNTAGIATLTSTIIQIANTDVLPPSPTGINMTIGGTFTSTVNSTVGSALLTHSRIAGAGNVSLQGGAQFPIEMLIYDMGPDVGDTGVDL